MYELSLLKALLSREDYVEYRPFIQTDEFSLELKPILRAIDYWHRNNENPPSIEDIANLVFAEGVVDKQREFLKATFTTMVNLNTEETTRKLLHRFKQEAVLKDLAIFSYEASLGKKSVDSVIELAAKLNSTSLIETVEYVTDDIVEIIDKHIRTPGLRWRLNCLNRSLGSLRKGDFGFIYARPETGKTTLISSEGTFMAEQLADDDGPILWFNNEESGEDVKFRNYLSALGATKEQVIKHPERAREVYQKKIRDKIRIIDRAAIDWRLIETLVEKEKPRLVLLDQIDKLKGFKADRKDLELGAIYQFSREIAKEYCPVIGVCQADGTAHNVRYLEMTHVAEAKTAKQAEADFILGIGRDLSQGFEFTRFLNISKNKLTGDSDTDPNARHGQFMVLIKPEIGRYEDID